MGATSRICLILFVWLANSAEAQNVEVHEVLDLGDSPARENLDPSTAENAQLPGTKVYLKMHGKDEVEDFPLATLKQLRKKVNEAQQEDDIFQEQQRAACKRNTEKFREAESKSSKLVAQAKQVREQCHERKQLARAEWKTSRSEERAQTDEADALKKDAHQSVLDFYHRSLGMQYGLDLLLKAGHALCLLLRSKDILTGECETAREEAWVDFPTDNTQIVSDESTREQHQAESEKYEASKQAEWDALAQAPERDPAKDPDKAGSEGSGYKFGGYPTRVGEGPLVAHTSQSMEHLEALVDHAVKLQKPMISAALSNILLAIKQGALSGKRGAKKAEGMVGLINRLRKQMADAYREDSKRQQGMLDDFTNRSTLIFNGLVGQQQKQHRLTSEMDQLDNRTSKSIDLLDWGDLKTTQAAKALKDEMNRCAGVEERIRLRNAERRQVTVRIHNAHEQISLKPMDAPYCAGGCGTEKRGTCVASEGQAASCLCNQGFYGANCEHTMCPGFGGGMFHADMQGACNGGICNSTKGICTSCAVGQYSGVQGACELRKCPSVDCSGNGQCDAKQGLCQCKPGWSGPECEHRTCPGPHNEQYAHDSHNACHGRGVCDTTTGMCTCQQPYMGDGCQDAGCLNDCTGHGICDTKRGMCDCQDTYAGPACELRKCPQDCNGHGTCSRLSGWCNCKPGFTGRNCEQSTGCTKQIADWWTSFDHEGWAMCPKGHLIQALYRNDCEGLACIESAQCVAPCEGATQIAPGLDSFNGETGRCYHQSWHDSFDNKGWSRCKQGFFLAGLYRSESDALYGLQQAKCCEIYGNTWHACTEADWSITWKAKGWSSVPKNKFLTGFYRGTKDTLSSITKASGCGFTHFPGF